MPRITCAFLAQIARSKGFTFEKVGGSWEYELFSNEYAPGVTGVYYSIAEAWQDVRQLIDNKNPLSNKPIK